MKFNNSFINFINYATHVVCFNKKRRLLLAEIYFRKMRSCVDLSSWIGEKKFTGTNFCKFIKLVLREQGLC